MTSLLPSSFGVNETHPNLLTYSPVADVILALATTPNG